MTPTHSAPPPAAEKVVQISVIRNFLKNNAFFQKVSLDIKDLKVISLQKRSLSTFFYLQALQIQQYVGCVNPLKQTKRREIILKFFISNETF